MHVEESLGDLPEQLDGPDRVVGQSLIERHRIDQFHDQ